MPWASVPDPKNEQLRSVITLGREQGDFLEEPVVYTRTVDGEVSERPAYTPADHVNLQARGWVKKNAEQPKATAPAVSAPKAAEPNAGSAPV
jgi:hypothetical protein